MAVPCSLPMSWSVKVTSSWSSSASSASATKEAHEPCTIHLPCSVCVHAIPGRTTCINHKGCRDVDIGLLQHRNKSHAK